jgi:hypothetical protein
VWLFDKVWARLEWREEKEKGKLVKMRCAVLIILIYAYAHLDNRCVCVQNYVRKKKNFQK